LASLEACPTYRELSPARCGKIFGGKEKLIGNRPSNPNDVQRKPDHEVDHTWSESKWTGWLAPGSSAKFIDPQAEFLVRRAREDKVMEVAPAVKAAPTRTMSKGRRVRPTTARNARSMRSLRSTISTAIPPWSSWPKIRQRGPIPTTRSGISRRLAGLNAIAEGFRRPRPFQKTIMKSNAAEWIVYDALYAYCQEMVRRGKKKWMALFK